MSLEEVIASVNFPVYGHACEVLELRYTGYSFSTPIPTLALTYHNNRYEHKLLKKFRRPAFLVGSSQGSRKIYEDLVCPPPCDPRITHQPFNFGGPIDDPNPFDLVEPITRGKEELILDGTHFIGEISYYPDPLFHSISLLWSVQTRLTAYTCGPSFEEVYELLKALHVLNPNKCITVN